MAPRLAESSTSVTERVAGAVGKEKAAKAMSSNNLSSVTQAVRLLKTFTHGESEMGITALAKMLGVSKSTTHRLASTLTAEGLLEQNKENGKYRLGITLFALGMLVRARMTLSTAGRQSVLELRDLTNETIHLAIRDGADVIYVYDVVSKQAIRMHSKLGDRKPALCTAEGLAMLAFEDPAIVDALIARGFEKRTPSTNNDPDYLRQALETVRRTGFAIETEQSEAGMRSVAVPIFGASGTVEGAIGLAGPMQRLSDEVLAQHVPHVVEEARRVSRRLGHQLVAQV